MSEPTLTLPQLHALAINIATKLNVLDNRDEWTFDVAKNTNADGDLSHYPHINHTDGRKIFFTESSWPAAERGKLQISGGWPSYTYTEHGDKRSTMVTPRDVWTGSHQESSPSIAVAISRGVDTIVKEILRRFLPEYTRVWLLCKARAEASAQYEKGRQEAWAKLCKAAGKDPKHSSFYLGDFDFGVYGDGKVSVKASSVPVDLALQILALLKARGETK